MIWSRSASVAVTDAVWDGSPSRVPPSPWKTWTISYDSWLMSHGVSASKSGETSSG